MSYSSGVFCIDYVAGSDAARTALLACTISNPSGSVISVNKTAHGLVAGAIFDATLFSAWFNAAWKVLSVTDADNFIVEGVWQATADNSGTITPRGGATNDPFATITGGMTSARTASGDAGRIKKTTKHTMTVTAEFTDGPLQPTNAITSSTNATPIALTLSAAVFAALNPLPGDTLQVASHATNTNANGTWEVGTTDPANSSFTLLNADGTNSVGNGVGGATGTVRKINNRRAKLSAAVTKNIAVCGNQGAKANWTSDGGANVVCSVITSDFKEGGECQQIAIGASFTTGLAAHFATGTLDLSGFQQVCNWLKQTVGTQIVAGDLSLKLCTGVDGTTGVVHTINFPAMPGASRWAQFVTDFATNMNSAVASIGLYVNVDRGAQTFLIDNIFASKDKTSVDSLVLSSCLGKDATTETCWPIQSINDKRVIFDGTTNTLPTAATRGYSMPAIAPPTLSEVSAASAHATSVAISTPQVGDLIVVCAYNASSSTIPTLPAGFVSPTGTASTATQGATAMRVGYRFSNGTETTSSTWANATDVTCVVYRGARRYSALAPLVSTNAASTGNGTAITIPATTINVDQRTYGWALAFVGAASAASGMNGTTSSFGTNRTNVTVAAALDTNAAASSSLFTGTLASSTLNVSGSGNWIGMTFVLMPPTYAGTWETVTPIKRETFKPAMLLNNSANWETFSRSGLTFSGGWDSTFTTQDGETWFDGQYGLGVAMKWTQNFIIALDHMSFVRWGGAFATGATPGNQPLRLNNVTIAACTNPANIVAGFTSTADAGWCGTTGPVWCIGCDTMFSTGTGDPYALCGDVYVLGSSVDGGAGNHAQASGTFMCSNNALAGIQTPGGVYDNLVLTNNGSHGAGITTNAGGQSMYANCFTASGNASAGMRQYSGTSPGTAVNPQFEFGRAFTYNNGTYGIDQAPVSQASASQNVVRNGWFASGNATATFHSPGGNSISRIRAMVSTDATVIPGTTGVISNADSSFPARNYLEKYQGDATDNRMAMNNTTAYIQSQATVRYTQSGIAHKYSVLSATLSGNGATITGALRDVLAQEPVVASENFNMKVWALRESASLTVSLLCRPYQLEGIATLQRSSCSYSPATVIGATNATPIVVQTGAAHNLSTGDRVNNTGMVGNTAGNGEFRVTVTDSTHFSLQDPVTGADVAGNGAWSSGGTVRKWEQLSITVLPTEAGVVEFLGEVYGPVVASGYFDASSFVRG